MARHDLPRMGPLLSGERERLRLWLFEPDGTLITTLRQTGTHRSLSLPMPGLARITATSGAAFLIMAHNHPSGDPRPSDADIAATRRVWRMARALGAALHDHLIVGHERTFSFRDNGLL